MHRLRVVARDDVWLVAVGVEQRGHVVVGLPPEHRGAADLVAVEVEDRQHGAVAGRVEVADRLPRPFERPGLGLAVADHARRDQVRVVEHRAEGVHERVAQLAALVDRAGCGHADVAGHATGGRELPEQVAHARGVEGRVGVDLGVGALEVDAGQQRRSAVAGAGQVDDVEVVPGDRPVEVGVEEAQPGRRAPVAEQAGLDVLGAERLVQQRVRLEVDLADREVVGRSPPPVESLDLVIGDGRHGLAPGLPGWMAFARCRALRPRLSAGRGASRAGPGRRRGRTRSTTTPRAPHAGQCTPSTIASSSGLLSPSKRYWRSMTSSAEVVPVTVAGRVVARQQMVEVGGVAVVGEQLVASLTVLGDASMGRTLPMRSAVRGWRIATPAALTRRRSGPVRTPRRRAPPRPRARRCAARGRRCPPPRGAPSRT